MNKVSTVLIENNDAIMPPLILSKEDYIKVYATNMSANIPPIRFGS